MKNLKTKKGVTLVELLIVISIVAILMNIVLSSVNISRTRAYDAKVKEQLSRFRVSAEIYYSNQNPNGYTPATLNCDGMFADMNQANGSPGVYLSSNNLPSGVQLVCAASQNAYAVKASLPSGGAWCVDSKGISKSISQPLGNPYTQCP